MVPMLPYWIDSHCHLNLKDLDKDLPEILLRAKNTHIQKMITICCEMDEMEAVYQIAHCHDSVYASVGVHPHEAQKDLETYGEDVIREALRSRTSLPKVVGLGETGLDFYYKNSPQKEQEKLFNVHLDVAEETGLPLIVHTREAEEDTIRLLKARKNPLKGVIHCFTGTQWLAHQALELGFYISISGVATFKNSEDLRETIKSIPLDKLLLETDAPYLAPVPKRGKLNEPSFMIHTATTVADLKGVSLETLSQATLANTKSLFHKLE